MPSTKTLYVRNKIKEINESITAGDYATFQKIWQSCQDKTKKEIIAEENILLRACAGTNKNITNILLMQKPKYIFVLLAEENYLCLENLFNSSSSHLLKQAYAQKIFAEVIKHFFKKPENNFLEKTAKLLLALFKNISISLTCSVPAHLGNIFIKLIEQSALKITEQAQQESEIIFKMQSQNKAQEIGKENIELEELVATDAGTENLLDAMDSAKHETVVEMNSLVTENLITSDLKDETDFFSKAAVPSDSDDLLFPIEDLDDNTLFSLFKENNFSALEKILRHIAEAKPTCLSTEVLLKLARFILDESLRGRWTIKNGNTIAMTLSDRDEALLSDDHKPNERKKILAINLFKCLNEELFACLINEEKMLSRSALDKWYEQKLKEKDGYVSYDPSDDSDSEDEAILNAEEVEMPRARRLKLLKRQHTKPGFWRNTRRSDTGGSGSFIKKANEMRNAKTNDATQIRNKLIQGTLKNAGKLHRRATLPVSEALTPSIAYVATFRGINYLPDRWDNATKRAHYKKDETGKTQYAEAVLMTGPSIYTKSADDSQQNPAPAYKETSERIQKIFREWAETGPCIAYTVKPSKEPYVFNSFSDYLQHCYSNGISQHLLMITDFGHTPHPWVQDKLPNSYNPALSTGERPYHSLRYALGLKEYYANPVDPCYNPDGSVTNPHSGKLDIFLFEKNEFINCLNMNRVNQMILEGRSPIDHNIAAEVETAFIGEIPGKHLVAQLPLRFPSFHKEYKSVYEVKYGLNEELYNLFKYFIQNTALFSEDRKAVIELLKEWLCAYYEVLAIFIAQELAENKQGKLIYLDTNNRESNVPPVRPFTRGHPDSQNQTHVLQNLRRYLGKQLTMQTDFTETSLFFPLINLEEKVNTLKNDENIMLEIVTDKAAETEMFKLTDSQEAEAFNDGHELKDIKAREAKKILTEHSYSFASQRGSIFNKAEEWITPKIEKRKIASDNLSLELPDQPAARKRLMAITQPA